MIHYSLSKSSAFLKSKSRNSSVWAFKPEIRQKETKTIAIGVPIWQKKKKKKKTVFQGQKEAHNRQQKKKKKKKKKKKILIYYIIKNKY